MKKFWKSYYENRHSKKKINKFYKKIEERKAHKKRQNRPVIATNKELLDDYKFFNSSLWLKHRYQAFVNQGNQCNCCFSTIGVVDVYSKDINLRLTDFNQFLKTLTVLCTKCSEEQGLNKVILQTKSSPVIRRSNPEINGFYNSTEWIALRNKAFSQYESKCYCCRQKEGQIHADHIKPRSKYPLLELDITNIQLLCWRCNLGKSNTDETNWLK